MKKESLRKKNRQAGFTLIEILIVLTIIALIGGLVGPKLFNKLGGANQKAAKAQISQIATACDTFRLDMGRFPKSLDELKNRVDDKKWEGPYLPSIPKDPWGNPYDYKCPGENGRDYDIISYGRDGTSGGSDEDKDIVSWKGIDDDEEDEG